MPACPSCQWRILKAFSPEVSLRLKRKNKDSGKCIGRWMGGKEVIITVWHWSMRKHLFMQYYKEIPARFVMHASQHCPRSCHCSTWYWLPGKEHCEMFGFSNKELVPASCWACPSCVPSAEGKDSHSCLTRSFGRMTGFEGQNFINKITLNIYVVKKKSELNKKPTALSTNTQTSSFSCCSLDLCFKNMLNYGKLFQTCIMKIQSVELMNCSLAATFAAATNKLLGKIWENKKYCTWIEGHIFIKYLKEKAYLYFMHVLVKNSLQNLRQPMDS